MIHLFNLAQPWNTGHFSNSGYTWLDLQSFESFLDIFFWGVGAPWNENLCYSYSQSLFFFYSEVLSTAGDTEFSEQWLGISQLVWLFWKEEGKWHTAFLKCVHRSSCRCLYSGSTSGNFFKTSENKKLRIAGVYHALCPKVISSMCGQVRRGLMAISGVYWRQTTQISVSFT